MAKRSHEAGQERKEDVEAAMERSEASASPGRYATASKVALSKRRIVSASRKWKMESSPPPPTTASVESSMPLIQPKTAPPAPPSSSGGIFANVSLTAATTTTTTTTTAADPNTSAIGVSSRLMDCHAKVLLASYDLKDSERLNYLFFKTLDEDFQNNPASDYQDWVRTYCDRADQVMTHTPPLLETTQTTTTTTTTTLSSNTPSFVFTPAPTPAVQAPPVFTGFSFGNPAAPPPPTAPAAGPTTTTTTTQNDNSNNNNNNNNNDDDAMPKDEPEQVMAENNTEEDCLLQLRAKYSKIVQGEWRAFSTGILRCLQHKVSQKFRIVLRNDVGKVQLNLSISHGMSFMKQKGKGGSRLHIQFVALDASSSAPQKFMLSAMAADGIRLYDTLNQMAGQ